MSASSINDMPPLDRGIISDTTASGFSGPDVRGFISEAEPPPTSNILNSLEDHLNVHDIRTLQTQITSCRVSFETEGGPNRGIGLQPRVAHTYMRDGKEYLKIKATWTVDILGQDEPFKRTQWFETDIALTQDIDKPYEQEVDAFNASMAAHAMAYAYRAAIDPNIADPQAMAKVSFLRSGRLHAHFKTHGFFTGQSYAHITFGEKGEYVTATGEPVRLKYPYEVVSKVAFVARGFFQSAIAFDLSTLDPVAIKFLLDSGDLEQAFSTATSLRPFIIKSDDPKSIGGKLSRLENKEPSKLKQALKDEGVDPKKYAKRLLEQAKRYGKHWEKNFSSLTTKSDIEEYKKLTQELKDSKVGSTLKEIAGGIGTTLYGLLTLPFRAILEAAGGAGRAFLIETGWAGIGSKIRRLKALDQKIRHDSQMSPSQWIQYRNKVSPLAFDAMQHAEKMRVLEGDARDKSQYQIWLNHLTSFSNFGNIEQMLKDPSVQGALLDAAPFVQE